MTKQGVDFSTQSGNFRLFVDIKHKIILQCVYLRLDYAFLIKKKKKTVN